MERVNKERNEVEINLADVFQILLSKWIYILIAGLVVALVVGAVTHFFIKKKYTATTTFYISANGEHSQTGTVTYSELSAADNLIMTYQEILKNNSVLNPVEERFNSNHPEYANLKITVGVISKALTVSVPTGTKLIRVAIKTEKPQLSADIANTFAEVVPEIMPTLTDGKASVIENATVPTTHSSPNLTLNVLIGFAAGVVLTAAFFLLRAFLDTTIYTSEEVAKVTQCPVIGTIPMIVVGNEDQPQWDVSLLEEIINE